MTDEIRTLNLGGNTAAVQVREDIVEAPKMDAVDEPTKALEGELFACFKRGGAAWPKELFLTRSSSEIVHAVRIFTQQINHERGKIDQRPLNAIELEELVARQSSSLALPLQHLCRWAVLSAAARKMQRELLGLVTMVPMPPGGSVKFSAPTEEVGRTHYMVTHILGERFTCRGYSTNIDNDGNWLIGGACGNRWYKDIWLMPGLQTIEALVEARRRKLAPGRGTKPASSAQARQLAQLERSLQSQRAAAGLSSDNFDEATGARLDLENKDIMIAALATVRALLAQVIVYQEDAIIDDVASRCGRTRAELVDDPDAAAKEAAAVRRHLKSRAYAYKHFRSVGSFAVPDGYMVFSQSGIPDQVPRDACTEITGVSGNAISVKHLEWHQRAVLRRNPAALPEVEDLSPIIDVCGVPTLAGKLVDDMELVMCDASGNETTDEDGVEYMQYRFDGQETTAKMPLADFLHKAAVRFVPMVINFHRRRLHPEDMQGAKDGLAWELSFEDISRRFRPCYKRKKSTT